ncbi:MAG TPA: alpha/beta fold hydrolase, partial [Vicinamibacterales bacterium]|nr:alpha/beta fold hydrolase [Vicinamibacterales bacterium]
MRFLVVFGVLLSIACQQPEAQTVSSGPVRVSIASDNATLVGDIYMPDRIPRGGVPGVAVVHGSGTMPRSMNRYVVGPLNAMGIAVLIYDKRGVGESTGTYSGVGTADSIEALGQLARDASNAAKVLAGHRGVDPKRIGLIGASQAGWIMPLAAAHDAGISFLIVISGPAVSVGYEILHGRLTNELNPSAATVPPEEAERRPKAFSGPYGYDPAPTLAALKTPTLWLMGDLDINLPLKETIAALKALPQISTGVLTLIQYPEGNHQLSRPDGSRVPYWDDVRAWLLKREII